MITIKSPREIELMRRAGKIVALAHQEVAKHVKPGVSTLYLDEVVEKVIRDNDAIPSFKGYGGFPGSICASVNHVVVHGIPSANTILKNGDIIAIDIGANYKGYHGDSAWTYAVGTISKEDQHPPHLIHLVAGGDPAWPGRQQGLCSWDWWRWQWSSSAPWVTAILSSSPRREGRDGVSSLSFSACFDLFFSLPLQ